MIRCLNQLYTRNPAKYIGDIEKLNKNETDKIIVLKKKFNQDNEKFISDLDNMKKSDDNVDSMDDFRYIKTLNVKSKINLVMPFVKILTLIFFIYAVFFGISYYFFVYVYNLFTDVNSYSTDFMNIQNTNLNNALLTQTIFNVNITDNQLNKFMTGDDTKGYLRTGFSKSFETLKKIRAQEDHTILKSILIESEQISQCKNIYSLSDVLYKNFDQITVDSLIETCGVYKFTNHGTIYTFNYELLYLQQTLLNEYEQTKQDYTKMKSVWDSFPFFDQLVINNLVMRPITDYFYNTLIYEVIISCIDNFVLYSLFYLICNMLADILILYLINSLIIDKIRKQDKEIKQFIMWT